MALVYWYKGEKRIRIDTANKVAVDSFTKKGYGPKEAAKAPPKITKVEKKGAS